MCVHESLSGDRTLGSTPCSRTSEFNLAKPPDHWRMHLEYGERVKPRKRTDAIQPPDPGKSRLFEGSDLRTSARPAPPQVTQSTLPRLRRAPYRVLSASRRRRMPYPIPANGTRNMKLIAAAPRLPRALPALALTTAFLMGGGLQLGAQEDPSIFSVVDTQGRTVTLGTSVQGTITQSDPLSTDGMRFQVWVLNARPGRDVRVALRSSEFDAFLTVVGPGLGGGLTNDDGGDSLNSLLCFAVPEGGETRLVAGALSGGVGGFSLDVSEGPEDCPVGDVSTEVALAAVPVIGSIAVGGAMAGAFTGSEVTVGGTPVQAWTLDGRAGDRLAILSTSDDMDGYLFFTGPGFDSPLTNDDGAGDLDPLICVELPEDGTYTIFPGILSSQEDAQSPRYRLSVTSADASNLCETYQQSPGQLAEWLQSLDTHGRTLEVGQTVSGSLADTDVRFPTTGAPIQAWSLRAGPGTMVWVDLISEDFDPLLRVVSAGGDESSSDDYDGAGWNSRVQVTVPENGTLLVVAGAFDSDGQGAFLLRASTDPPPPLEVNGEGEGEEGEPGVRDPSVLEAVLGDVRGSLDVGTEVTARLEEGDPTLENGNHAQAWTVSGRAGDDLVLIAASQDFDAMIYVVGPGLEDALFNDDDGYGLNSRLQFRLPETGTYTVVVGGVGGGVGEFRLAVMRASGGN